MAIDFIQRRERYAVAWFGASCPNDGKKVFEEQDFQVLENIDEELRDNANLHGLAAVVFTQKTIEDNPLFRGLRKHALRLLDNNCRIIVRSIPSGMSGLTSFIRNEMHLDSSESPDEHNEPLPPLPHIRIYNPSISWERIANFIVENPPGKFPNWDLVIDVKDKNGNEKELCESSKCLIRRAFCDCEEVHLQEQSENSGISVYRAFAVRSHSNFERQSKPKQWHLPYFVKLGERKKVYKEYKNYLDKVDPFIPFHLGPHLDHKRCSLGANKGIIVGDFVEESESLISCASDGRATAALACLFDRTLHGWHSYVDEESDQTVLSRSFSGLFPRKVPPTRLALAKRLDTKTSDLSVLRALFDKGIELTPLLVGPIHGDLHADNVRVRASDAIVIDFYSSRERGPILFDAACLEASLLVDGFAANDDKRDFDEWLVSVETLYTGVPLDGVPDLINPKDPSFWFHMCVRRIRLYARQMECKRGQYAVLLALAFLIKASKDPYVTEPEASLRAGAYILAERLLRAAVGSSQTTYVAQEPVPS